MDRLRELEINSKIDRYREREKKSDIQYQNGREKGSSKIDPLYMTSLTRYGID